MLLSNVNPGTAFPAEIHYSAALRYFPSDLSADATNVVAVASSVPAGVEFPQPGVIRVLYPVDATVTISIEGIGSAKLELRRPGPTTLAEAQVNAHPGEGE